MNTYDLVYGVLFDPVNTYRRVADKPPVGLTVALILGLNLLLAIMGMVAGNTMDYADRFMTTMQNMAPMIAILGFIFNAAFWFVYSSVLHLIAQFFGGRGDAIATFTAYGLAGLPALFLLPLQGLEIIFNHSGFFNALSVMGSLAVAIWGIVLLVIAIREVHHLTTNRAVLVVVTPWIIGFVLIVMILVMMVGAISSVLPYIEQFGKM
jgi:hypothetical protein